MTDSIKKDSDGNYVWEIKDDNGNVISSGKEKSYSKAEDEMYDEENLMHYAELDGF